MEKITSSLNVNYSKMAKFFLLIPVIIIAIAIAMTALLGVNYTAEIKGRYEVTVNFGVELDNNKVDEYVTKISNALKENDMKMTSYSKSGQSIYNKLIVTIDNSVAKMDEDRAEEVRKAIEDNLKESINSTIEVQDLQYVSSSIGSYIVKAVIAIAVAIVAIFVYLWIRYNISVATSTIVGGVLAIVLTFAIYAICRIPFDAMAIVNMFISFIVTVALAIFLFDNIRNMEMSEVAMTNNQYLADSNIMATKSFACVMTFAVLVLLAIAIVMLFINVQLFLVFITLIIAIILAIYSAMFGAGSLWSIMYNKDRDQRLRNRIEKAKQAETNKSKKKKDDEEDQGKILV